MNFQKKIKTCKSYLPFLFEALFPALVVKLSLVWIREGFVGGSQLLELFIGVGIVPILVRVHLFGHLAVSLFNGVRVRVSLHAQDFVIVSPEEKKGKKVGWLGTDLWDVAEREIFGSFLI